MNLKFLIPVLLIPIAGIVLFFTVFSQSSVSEEDTNQTLIDIISSQEYKKHDKMKSNRTSKTVLKNDKTTSPSYLNIKEATLEHDSKGVGRLIITLKDSIPEDHKEHTLMYGVEITDLKNPKKFFYNPSAYKVMQRPMHFSLELANLRKSKDKYFKGFSKDNVLVMNFRIPKLGKKDKVDVRLSSFGTEGIRQETEFFSVENKLKR